MQEESSLYPASSELNGTVANGRARCRFGNGIQPPTLPNRGTAFVLTPAGPSGGVPAVQAIFSSMLQDRIYAIQRQARQYELERCAAWPQKQAEI